MKRALILALILAGGTVALSGGCVPYTKADGSTGYRPDPDKIEAGGQGAAVVGASTGTPWGALGGIVVASVTSAVAAYLRGQNRGYDQGSLDAGKPLASAGSK